MKIVSLTDTENVKIKLTVCYTAHMEQQLEAIGLSPKESRVYLLLLEQSDMTASDVAERLGFKRPNAYAVLDQLAEQHLIEVVETDAVKTFRAAHPAQLQRLVQQRIEQEQQAAAGLQKVLPLLRSQHALASNKPGVVHMAGVDGFITLLDDMIRSTSEVLLIASNEVPQDQNVLKQFRDKMVARVNAGVGTRALFHSTDQNERFKYEFGERGIMLRFLHSAPFETDIALYEDNIAFTIYKPVILTTVITNQVMAGTMREVFEQLWCVSFE